MMSICPSILRRTPIAAQPTELRKVRRTVPKAVSCRRCFCRRYRRSRFRGSGRDRWRRFLRGQCRCRRGRQRLRAACGSRLSFEKVGSSEFDTAGVLRTPPFRFWRGCEFVCLTAHRVACQPRLLVDRPSRPDVSRETSAALRKPWISKRLPSSNCTTRSCSVRARLF